jgi:hypothetical protein
MFYSSVTKESSTKIELKHISKQLIKSSNELKAKKHNNNEVTSIHSVEPISPNSSAPQLQNIIERRGLHLPKKQKRTVLSYLLIK